MVLNVNLCLQSASGLWQMVDLTEQYLDVAIKTTDLEWK